MQRQVVRFLMVLLALMPFLVGMGGGGGGPQSDSIPRPKESYSADLVDRQGVGTRVSFLSCNGKTFLPLTRGEGTLMVPFAKVDRIRFGGEKGPDVDATLHVQGGKPLEGKLPRSLLCTGSTDYGNYQVEARGLKEIVFVRQ